MSKYVGKRIASLTREERFRRKYMRMFIANIVLFALLGIGLIVYGLYPLLKSAGEEPVVEEAPVVQIIDEIEAAPMEYDPVRDDIPMDAEHQRLLYKACGETGIRYELALAVIWQETDFRNIEGDGGESYGYMQVQPKWHKERMERLGVTDLSDPYGNFLVGLDFLYELVGKYGDVEKALVAYNQGEFKGVVTEYASGVSEKFNKLAGGALDVY